MSATSDTFARFVDVLAETLDEPRRRRARHSRRALHLSRFHFDRLVSAAAGEPPAALRRRILLERAAYRLLTTDGRRARRRASRRATRSHEAFTRAFTRAYGSRRPRWRNGRRGFQLEAPSGVHFHPTRRPAAAGANER